ncbi:MAG TPA: hypothetical protein VMI33_04770 [Streptosporangiaceae bacterium]|nr:hypothetical protein [Streptosporangiaceae bacterium]
MFAVALRFGSLQASRLGQQMKTTITAGVRKPVVLTSRQIDPDAG